MRTYIFFNNKKLPSGVKAMVNIYDKSFKGELFSGGKYRKRPPELPYVVQFRWPKWIDNPNTPDYARFTSIDLYFSPFNKDLRVSKKVMKCKKDLGLKNIALVEIYSVGTTRNTIAQIDCRTYLRTVYYYAKECNGTIYLPFKNKLINADQFHQLYKEYIEYPFNRRLKKKDFTLINLKRIFNK